MTTTVSLGDWCMARCTIGCDEAGDDVSELVIVSPASVDDGPSSITIVGLEAIIALRDLIDDETKLAESRAELAQEVVQND